MILLIGPCMFVAPLLVVLVPVAIVLWPPTLVLLGVLWLLVWPFAAVAGGDGTAGIARAHRTIGRWFRTLLTPWTYFDAPKTPPTPPQGTASGAAHETAPETARESAAPSPVAPAANRDVPPG
ncbi:MAG TPA: hypothetical protein VG916_11060 [Gemmatimonadaceae bacterium]|nr:hypothetical protein [Gemmatimonadaceae bacterium]